MHSYVVNSISLESVIWPAIRLYMTTRHRNEANILVTATKSEIFDGLGVFTNSRLVASFHSTSEVRSLTSSDLDECSTNVSPVH